KSFVLEPLDDLSVRFRKSLATCGHCSLAVEGYALLHRFNQIRKRRLGIRRNGKVDLREALEILIICFHIEVRGTNADKLCAGPNDAVVVAFDGVMERVRGSPQILNLNAYNDIGFPDHRTGALALIERMPRRKIHAAAKVDHGALQKLGELDQSI